MAKKISTRPVKDSDIDLTAEKLPKELKDKLLKLPPRARKYAEFRAKGLSQALAAEKAGSKANPKTGALSRVGYSFEQLDGIKEYIVWLEQRRAQASVIDDIEIVDKLREIYTEAFSNGKFGDAVKAVELMGHMIGAFSMGKGTGTSKAIKDAAESMKHGVKSTFGGSVVDKYSSFKDDYEDETPEEKIKRLQGMLQQAKVVVK